MGIERNFVPEMLVVGVLFTDEQRAAMAETMMRQSFGDLWLRSEPEPFGWTRYYVPEMGEGIMRAYWAFERLIDPSELADIKLATNRIEQMLAIDGKRLVNLDPGTLGPGRFCLATTKDRAHRIPLHDGIYAELTLIYERGAFHPLPWTYPDWASEPVRGMLAGLRQHLLGRLKAMHLL
ncbi:MAG: DUF4416 family protein [Spirochaetaceae bacterium]|nr:DUF4416 family protein [Spirochaetaceae bacterium]